ncbi:MAG: type I-E CRISPR-associated protein Cse2/CasB [Coriobacteriia bacterium]|nr:type I-E CRISPR-associated protein Cse2/CasB [Coriobacteriia bacterium]
MDERVSQLQRDYIGRRGHAVATLARLRRGVGKPPGATAGLWEATLEGVPLPARYGDEPTSNEWATYAAVTLFAIHQQSQGTPMHEPGRGLGKAVRMLCTRNAAAGRSQDAVRRRFEALGTATDFAEVVHHARGLIGQLRTFGIPLDYGRLAEDFVWLQRPQGADRVRLAWGRDFYSEDHESGETPVDDTGKEARGSE